MIEARAFAGIVGYGAYIPYYRISVEELAYARGGDVKRIISSLAIKEKSVAGSDEDAVTMGVQAAKNALARAGIMPNLIGGVYVGSESHPYVVKPSATLVGQALNIGMQYFAADMEFACKSGTAALQASMALVLAGMCEYSLAIGSDTAQAAPHDILEYTASAGAAAFILGRNPAACVALIEKTISISTDTPDFWRRSSQKYPEHTGRFTAQPAYFYHVVSAARQIFEQNSLKASDFDFVVFHQPNAKFPVAVAKELGFTQDQYGPGLLATEIGNSYSASVLLGLTRILDHAKSGQRILVVSYGSGSGSDAFIIKTTERITQVQQKVRTTGDYIKQKKMLTYTGYEKMITGSKHE
ncbi:MAG: hydroxymethylglutaryl-CoA synthase [bacterium]